MAVESTLEIQVTCEMRLGECYTQIRLKRNPVVHQQIKLLAVSTPYISSFAISSVIDGRDDRRPPYGEYEPMARDHSKES